MATTTVKPQTPALLTVSAAAYYTVTAGSVVGNVKELLFCNTTAIDRNATVYYVPSGQSATAAYMIINAVTIGAGVTVRFPFNSFLAAGGSVQALANAGSAISFLVSPVEYS